MTEFVHADHSVWRKVLLKTPSGFAMFDIKDFVLKEVKNIWIYFSDSRYAQQILLVLGFVRDHEYPRNDDDSVKDMIQLIQKFCKSGDTLFVEDAEIKATIEKRLDVKCICDGRTVDELIWGIKNVLHEFIREDKAEMTAKFCLPLSVELLKALREYLINISMKMLDGSFISKFGFLCYLDMNSKAVSKNLRESYDKFIGISESIEDDLDYAKLLTTALVPAFVRKYGFSETFSPELLLKLEEAKKKSAKLQVDLKLFDIQTILGSLDYLLNAPDVREHILMRVKLMEASRFKSEISQMIYEIKAVNGLMPIQPVQIDKGYLGFCFVLAGSDHVDFEKGKFLRTLLETPSGFAIFNIHEAVFKYSEHLWRHFSDTSDAHHVAFALGYVKVDKSDAWDNITCPSDKLRHLILRFCKDKELVVQSTELCKLIVTKLGVNCLTDEKVVNELMWGLKYVLYDFILEESGKLTDKYYIPLCKGLQEDLEFYRLHVSQERIDRDFIYTFGHVVNLDVESKAIFKALDDEIDPRLRESIHLIYRGVLGNGLNPEAEDPFLFSGVFKDLSRSNHVKLHRIYENFKSKKCALEHLRLCIDNSVLDDLGSMEIDNSIVDDPHCKLSNISIG